MEKPPSPLPDPKPNPNEIEFLDDPSSGPSFLWEWGDLLDFSLDVEDERFPELSSSFDSLTVDPASTNESTPQLDRVRKRDPRLTCSNFLAGRVPCSCPELEEEEEEEEKGIPSKKKARVGVGGGRAQCQVPGCEADISELKGYHKRHRICLRCAHAGAVVLDGETKRYCQQCGKFHVLSDFDEGKKSCRRKLERHNIRRRRKPSDSRVVVDKETGRYLRTDEVACDGEPGKGDLCISDQIVSEKEFSVEPEDGHASVLHSDPSSQNVNGDSGISFAASGDNQTDGKKEDSKLLHSPSYRDNKSAYSSVCPTGRISFKLYNWNPAEFPRRLRHQIFQWLASMPVELEGYIRPGCTILTSFIAMPKFMWVKLLEDPVSYVHDLVIVPGQMLSGRGPILIYLNNSIFQVMKDGYSLMKVNVKEKAPRLHYVHPMCFEAGRPMEFVACGSNLLQCKFQFLVSFAGKYLTYDSCVALPCHHVEGISSMEHQLYQIFIPCIEPNLLGPAFIEVENESGLSNFIPVLIGNREICCEMEMIQQKFDASLPNGSNCEAFASSQVAFSEFLVDIAWLLKEPSLGTLQQYMTSSQIQRFTSLLKFLLHHDFTAILDRVLRYLKSMMDEIVETSANDRLGVAEMHMLLSYVKYASNVLSQKLEINEALILQSMCSMQENNYIPGNFCESRLPSAASSRNQDLSETSNCRLDVCATPNVGSDKVPLLSREVVMKMDFIKESSSKSFNQVLSSRVLKSCPTILVITVVAICFGACAAILHPQKVSQFAVSIRRCLADRL